jgi:hypothetical protein
MPDDERSAAVGNQPRPSGSILIGTPGASIFSRDPKPSVSNDDLMSPPLCRKWAQPSVWYVRQSS